MHIEPGVVAPAKVMMANIGAAGLFAYYAKSLIKNPLDILRAVVAAVFFSFFMQSFHMSVGPSELHFVGGMALYLTVGFIPTLIGFAAGLLLQAILFDPQDMMHLAVNSLTLGLPLILTHFTLGHKLRNASKEVRWGEIVKLDAIYYTGVTVMVGVWLAIAQVETPLVAWASFALSYLSVVALEPVFTYVAVRALKRFENNAIIDALFAVKALKVGA